MASAHGLLRNTLLRSAIMISIATFSMGNQSCKQQQQEPVPTQGRVLRKKVEVGRVDAAAIQLPNGGRFDFAFAANSQMYDVLRKSGNFTLNYQTSSPTPADQNILSLIKSSDDNDFSGHLSSDSSCLVEMNDLKIGGAISGFEMVSGKGLKLGYSPNGAWGPVAGIGMGYDVQKAQMDLTMVAYHPITRRVMATSHQTPEQTIKSMNFSLDLAGLQIGPSYWRQTPLAQVVFDGLSSAIAQIAKDLETDAWYTRVLHNVDDHVIINGGGVLDSGLKVGDQLITYREVVEWDGDPCNSEYKGSFPQTTALGLLEVVSVGDTRTLAKKMKGFNPEPNIRGVRVYMFKTVEELSAAKPPPAAPIGSAPATGTTPQAPAEPDSGSNQASNGNSNSNSNDGWYNPGGGN